ncbi:hypothetical protein NMS21_001464 [Vibrio alginolyticus]|nr:hypothetical protein [Vibrio alginolyticus]
MGDWFKFEWVFISWIISLLIHHNNIRRSTVSDKVDEVIKLVNELAEYKWCKDGCDPFYNEERYNAKLSRIRWKIIQLNRLASCSLVDIEKLKPFYTFDIETYLHERECANKKLSPKLKRRPPYTKPKTKEELEFSLEDNCASFVEYIEERHFKKALRSKWFFLWPLRFTIAGILFGFTIVYLFIEIMSFFYGS